MKDDILTRARKYEKEAGERITKDERPAFHLTPLCGWTNDPNGFSIYGGKYHLFYQYNPYSTHWDTMHWGHAVSTDLLHWEWLPTALSPDNDYDKDGCFSGSAIEIEDGRQLLIYTGVQRERQSDGSMRDIQTQCLAVGNGVDYTKFPNNPVITSDMLPSGANPSDFRDPHIWKKSDGTFCCTIGSRPADGSGQILLYTSKDGFSWQFWKTLSYNGGRFGKMWECPDFFALDGFHLLLVSPQDMLASGTEYHSGNGTVCFIGSYNEETGAFEEKYNQTLDYGMDFYAPQTLLSNDGRRIMIGWMQNWDSCSIREADAKWMGQMSIPRELFVRGERLWQRPIRELEALRANAVSYHSVALTKEPIRLEGISGRVVDMEIDLHPLEECFSCTMQIACGNGFHTDIVYRPHERTVYFDRRFSGTRRALVHQCECKVLSCKEVLHFRLILDRFSAELFINGGEQVMTASFYTPQEADGITFASDGKATLDVTKYAFSL